MLRLHATAMKINSIALRVQENEEEKMSLYGTVSLVRVRLHLHQISTFFLFKRHQ